MMHRFSGASPELMSDPETFVSADLYSVNDEMLDDYNLLMQSQGGGAASKDKATQTSLFGLDPRRIQIIRFEVKIQKERMIREKLSELKIKIKVVN